MSTRRVALEIGAVVAVLGLGLALVFWLAGSAAALLTPLVPLAVDRTLGEHAWGLASGAPDCTDPGPKLYVEHIAEPLLQEMGPTPFSFTFRVVDSKDVNAFALPGGFVTVNMSLLESARSGEEVAAVLGHELAHVTERHGIRRVLRRMGGATLLYWVFGGSDMAGPAALAADLASTAYDRDQERESDRIGLALMLQAGLDPMGMARFFERLSQDAVTPPEWVSTHPDPGNRARAATEAAAGFTPSRTLPSPRGLRCR
jgi:beta-barrel assembly-enhancing protease